MPATCALSGTPASISARQPPHTEAIDDEPFDSVISETTRIEYGNSVRSGSTATSARLARRHPTAIGGKRMAGSMKSSTGS